jgi:hypothetical protein
MMTSINQFSMEEIKMKTWNAAEIVELNIAETAHGHKDFIVEASINGWGTNNDMIDGNDTPGSDPNPEQGKGDNNNSVTPDTLS